MLYVIESQKKSHLFHIGDLSSISSKVPIQNVESLQADGEELDAIRDQFHHIPMSYEAVVEWFGDDAKFIASNLVLKKGA